MIGVDHNWRPTARWNVRTRADRQRHRAVRRDQHATPARRCGPTTRWITAGASSGSRCISATSCRSTTPAISRRNSTNYAHWQVQSPLHRSAGTSRATRPRTGAGASAPTTTITDSCSSHQFRISRESRLRNGSYEYGQINVNSAGVDDLLTRGNGAVNLPPNFNCFLRVRAAAHGQLGLRGRGGSVSAAGSRATTSSATASSSSPRYFLSDALQRVRRALGKRSTPDWLVWQQRHADRQLRRARDAFRRRIQLDHRQPPGAAPEAAGDRLGCGPAPGVSRRYRGQLRLPTDEPVDDFSVSNLGLQIRYRYELAPLSYLYVVYGRGGFEQEANGRRLRRAGSRQLQPARRRAAADQAQLSLRNLDRDSAPRAPSSPRKIFYGFLAARESARFHSCDRTRTLAKRVSMCIMS